MAVGQIVWLPAAYLPLFFLILAAAGCSRKGPASGVEAAAKLKGVESVILVGAGLIFTLKVMLQWIVSGFGPLNEQRFLFFALLCLVNGVQIGADMRGHAGRQRGFRR